MVQIMVCGLVCAKPLRESVMTNPTDCRFYLLEPGQTKQENYKRSTVLISDAPRWFAIRSVDQQASYLLFPTYLYRRIAIKG